MFEWPRVSIENVKMAEIFGVVNREILEKREKGGRREGAAENFFIVDKRRPAWTERGRTLGMNEVLIGFVWARWGGVPRFGTGAFSLPRVGILRPFTFFCGEFEVAEASPNCTQFTLLRG